jgi:hypothetical protein
MRRILILIIAGTCISFCGYTQISKGSVLLGGGISFNNVRQTVNNPDSKEDYLTVTPVIGVAVKENLVMGIQLTYGHSESNTPFAPLFDNNNYGAELFIRKYLPLGKGFYLFGQSGVYYRTNNYKYTYPAYTAEQKDRAVGINLYPGISYAITKKFHLEAGLASLASLEYSTNKITNAGTVTQNKKAVSLNASASSLSNFNIGFRFFLAKK